MMKTEIFTREVNMKDNLIHRAYELQRNIIDLLRLNTTNGRRVHRKYNQNLNDIADVLAIYKLICDEQCRKAYNKIQDLDTIIREDLVDHKIHNWLQELYE